MSRKASRLSAFNGSARGLALILWSVTLLLVACQSPPTGPSLANVVLTPVVPTPTTNNNPAQCCCHVVTRATNRNSVPVDITIKFSAFSALQNDAFAKIVYFIPDLTPGSGSNVDAPGFLVPCSSIDHILYEVEVKGLVSPPS